MTITNVFLGIIMIILFLVCIISSFLMICSCVYLVHVDDLAATYEQIEHPEETYEVVREGNAARGTNISVAAGIQLWGSYRPKNSVMTNPENNNNNDYNSHSNNYSNNPRKGTCALVGPLSRPDNVPKRCASQNLWQGNVLTCSWRQFYDEMFSLLFFTLMRRMHANPLVNNNNVRIHDETIVWSHVFPV